MDEPKVESTGRTTGIQYLVIQNGQILFAVSSRKMALRLSVKVKEGDHLKKPPPHVRGKM
tara:strand:- start:78 stop:257 length:180 start_codon:yes stop_codon:yes gene_type:complete